MLRNAYRDDYGSDQKYKAQKNLAGRTHYVDDDTLRYFRSRILACRIHDDGTLLSIVESFSVNPDHSERAFRAVVFDIEGTTVFRPDIEHAHKTRKSAEKELWVFLNSFDGVVAAITAIERRIERQTRDDEEQLDELRSLLLSETVNA